MIPHFLPDRPSHNLGIQTQVEVGSICLHIGKLVFIMKDKTCFSRPIRKTYLFCVLLKSDPWTVSLNEGRRLSCHKERPNEYQGPWPCESCLIVPNALSCCLQKSNFFFFFKSTSDFPLFNWSRNLFQLCQPQSWGLIPNQDRLIDADLEFYTKQEECISFPYDFLQRNI